MDFYKEVSSNDDLGEHFLKSLESFSSIYSYIEEDAAIYFDPRTGMFMCRDDFQKRLFLIEYFVRKVISSKDPGFGWRKIGNKPNALTRYDGSSYIKELYNIFPLLAKSGSGNLQYSEYVQLFFDIVAEMNLRYYTFMAIHLKSDDPRYQMTGGKSFLEFPAILCGELFNEFIKRIRKVAASVKFKRKVRARANNSKQNFQNYKEFIDDLFKVISELLVLRIECEYDKEIAHRITLEQAQKDRDHFLNNMRNNDLFKTVKGYIWKFEEGEIRGPHFHFIFFLDGSLSIKDDYLAEQFGRYWVETVTQGRGIYYNCNRHPRNYKKLGIGIIDHADEIKRRNLMIVLKSLTKKEQYLKIKGVRTIGRSETPVRPISKTGKPIGRPRKYDSCQV